MEKNALMTWLITCSVLNQAQHLSFTFQELGVPKPETHTSVGSDTIYFEWSYVPSYIDQKGNLHHVLLLHINIIKKIKTLVEHVNSVGQVLSVLLTDGDERLVTSHTDDPHWMMGSNEVMRRNASQTAEVKVITAKQNTL